MPPVDPDRDGRGNLGAHGVATRCKIRVDDSRPDDTAAPGVRSRCSWPGEATDRPEWRSAASQCK